MPTETTPATRRSKRSSARAAADARDEKATATEAPTSEIKKQTAAQSLANLFQDNTGGGGGEGQDVVANLMGAEGGEGVAAEGEAEAEEGGDDEDEEPKAKKVRLEEDMKSSSPPPDVVIGATGVAVAQPKMDEGKPPADGGAHSPVPAPIPMAAVGGAPSVPVPGPLATAISKLPASTPQRAAGAAALAALSTASKPVDVKKEEAAAAAGGAPAGSVAVPALPPIAEVQQPGGGTVQHDYLLQNLVHASKVSSPLPVPRGRGRAILHGPPPAGMGRGYPGPYPAGGRGMPYQGMPALPGQVVVQPPAPPLPPQKSRKEKSLGVLCQNFMDLFKNAPPNRDNNGTVIEICQVADHLGVKRRRIYDVINVLESIDIVCRVKKNTYRWHGRDGLPRFFAELQKAGLEERGRSQAVAAHAAAAQQAAATGEAPPPPVPPLDGQPTSIVKTKGMAQTCQKLIQIFLVTGRVEIGLSDAAEEVLGPLMPTDETNAQRAMKTKVRRMYDIANVLQAIGIVQKENVGSTSLQNKPSFRWVYHILPCDMSNYLNASPAPAQPLIVSRVTSVPSVPPPIPVATRVALPQAPVVALPPPQPATVNPEGVASAVAAAANVELPLDEPEVEVAAEAAAAAVAAVGEAVAVDAPVAEDLAPAANSATEQVEI